jgi:ABC-type nitrate/sulfonate/bicarbonate transport system substrate-binding protein
MAEWWRSEFERRHRDGANDTQAREPGPALVGKFINTMKGNVMRRLLASTASSVIALTMLSMPGFAQDGGFGFSLDQVSAGTDIPAVEMSLGMRPVANDLIFVSGIKQGFFGDVGIKITPEPYGRKVLFDQATPLLVNKEIDIQTTYPPDLVAALDTVKNVRFIGFSDLFQGFAVLARPGSGTKTVRQFMQEGMNFNDAMKATMAQLKGKSFATAPNVDNRIFLDTVFSLGAMAMDADTKLVITPDANTLQLASGGKVDFASPDGAPFTAQLEGAGWIPLVTPVDVLENMDPTPGSPAAGLVGTPGIASDADWARANKETVLRFVSVMFRLIQQEQKDPDTMLGAMLDYVNAFAGTTLDLDKLKLTIDALSPLSNFEFQQNYCVKVDSPLYYKTAFNAHVKFNVEKGLLSESEYDPNSLIWTCEIYSDLVELKSESDKLLAGLQGKALSSDEQALVDKAKQQYGWFNYLDSYRLLKAVKGS